MTKTIEEAAREYASENMWYPGETSYESDIRDMEQSFADAFRAGANHVKELPLRDRLTAEKKEQIRFAHKTAKTFAERTNPMSAEVFKGQYLLLESIFGADFFKEGE